jgi:ferredoxin
MSQSDEDESGAVSWAAPTVDSFRLTLDGEDHTVPIAAGETHLQAALAAGIDAPHSCTEGRCGTCMSWLRNGDVAMATTRALSPRKRERGNVLASQALPSSPHPNRLDFDL